MPDGKHSQASLEYLHDLVEPVINSHKIFVLRSGVQSGVIYWVSTYDQTGPPSNPHPSSGDLIKDANEGNIFDVSTHCSVSSH